MKMVMLQNGNEGSNFSLPRQSEMRKYVLHKQDLCTRLRCYSLGSPFNIQPCGFFLKGWKCIF